MSERLYTLAEVQQVCRRWRAANRRLADEIERLENHCPPDCPCLDPPTAPELHRLLEFLDTVSDEEVNLRYYEFTDIIDALEALRSAPRSTTPEDAE